MRSNVTTDEVHKTRDVRTLHGEGNLRQHSPLVKSPRPRNRCNSCNPTRTASDLLRTPTAPTPHDRYNGRCPPDRAPVDSIAPPDYPVRNISPFSTELREVLRVEDRARILDLGTLSREYPQLGREEPGGEYGRPRKLVEGMFTMMDSLPALIFGGLLILVAGVSVWYQQRLRVLPADADDLARLHAERQYRRRLQVAAMLATVGILIPLGDNLPFFRQAPVAFVMYWAAVLMLTGWIALLAIADLASTRAYHGRATRSLQRQREELEDQLARFRVSRNGSRIHSDE